MINKEDLRQKRKEVYQKAKAKRDADPRYQALKEAAKLKRREKYQALMKKHKNEKIDAKLKRKAEKDAALMAMMMPASMLEKKVDQGVSGDTLAALFRKASPPTSNGTHGSCIMPVEPGISNNDRNRAFAR